MQVTMKDRVAVVTGGSKGIGLAVARQFAASGAKVAILARGAADLKAARELLAKDGLEIRDYACDVAKAADIAKAHEKITADLGPVDILVNNAGTAGRWRSRTSLTKPGRKTSTSNCSPRSVSPGWSGRA
jgi:NAD(P)-dependent dehydrogenase (short-subunit alcohol dehydrogenase family)